MIPGARWNPLKDFAFPVLTVRRDSLDCAPLGGLGRVSIPLGSYAFNHQLREDNMHGSRLIAPGLLIGLLCMPALAPAATQRALSFTRVPAESVVTNSFASLPATTLVDSPADAADASQLYGSYVGDANDDALYSVARDSDGNYYFGGYTGDGAGGRKQLVGKMDSTHNSVCIAAFPLVDPDAPTTHIYDQATVLHVAAARDGNFYAVGTAHDTTSTPGDCNEGTSTPGDCDGFLELISGTDCSVLSTCGGGACTAIIGDVDLDRISGVSAYIDPSDPTLDRAYISGSVGFSSQGVPNTFEVGKLNPNVAEFNILNVSCRVSTSDYLCLWDFMDSDNAEGWSVANTNAPPATGQAFHGGLLRLSAAPVDQKLFLVASLPNGAIPPGGAVNFTDDGPSRFSDARLAANGNILYAGNLNNPDGGNGVFFKILADFSDFTWAQRFADTTNGAGIDGDASDNSYVVGNTAAGHSFVLKLDPTGTLTDGGSFGGSGVDTALGVAWGESNSSATAVGQTTSADFPVTDGSALNGPSDGCILEAGNFM
jgi:hypothetical protein